MNGETSVNDVLIRIQAAAREHNVNVTYANMMVYLKLIEYSKEYKNTVEVVGDSKSIRFEITTLVLAKYCNVAPRTVTESLRKLKECGVIDYTINKPLPSTVRLYRRYFE